MSTELDKQKSLSDISSIGNFVLAKNGRLVSALYMVTNVLTDSEPLKWKLRELALNTLLAANLSFKPWTESAVAGGGSEKFVGVERLMSQIGELLSLITVALNGADVSPMNFTILKQEYEALKNLLAANFSPTNFRSYLFTGGENRLSRLEPTSPLLPAIENTFSVRPEAVRSPSLFVSAVDVKKEARGFVKSAIGPKGGRQDAIWDYLKGRDWTSIKDIAKAIAGCSVKTIQRELVDMVALAVLEKTGERRWSRYRLSGV